MLVLDGLSSTLKKRKRNLETLDLQRWNIYPETSPEYELTQLYSSLSSSQSELLSPWPLSPNLVIHSDPISSYQLPTPNSSSRSFHSTASNLPSLKRRRLPLSSKTHFRQQSTPTISSATSATQAPNLAACHVCHCRPSANAALFGNSSCELCEQRTCYVCIRICEAEGCRSSGESGKATDESDREFRHAMSNTGVMKGKAVCRKCCKEVGPEGNVWCLLCFEDDGEEDRRGRDSGDDEGDCVETGRVEEWLESFNR